MKQIRSDEELAEVERKDEPEEEVFIPNREEVLSEIYGLNKNKANERYGIAAEMIKCGVDTLMDTFCGIVQKIWMEERCQRNNQLE